jgi:hypothetical protein
MMSDATPSGSLVPCSGLSSLWAVFLIDFKAPLKPACCWSGRRQHCIDLKTRRARQLGSPSAFDQIGDDSAIVPGEGKERLALGTMTQGCFAAPHASTPAPRAEETLAKDGVKSSIAPIQ